MRCSISRLTFQLFWFVWYGWETATCHSLSVCYVGGIGGGDWNHRAWPNHLKTRTRWRVVILFIELLIFVGKCIKQDLGKWPKLRNHIAGEHSCRDVWSSHWIGLGPPTLMTSETGRWRPAIQHVEERLAFHIRAICFGLGHGSECAWIFLFLETGVGRCCVLVRID